MNTEPIPAQGLRVQRGWGLRTSLWGLSTRLCQWSAERTWVVPGVGSLRKGQRRCVEGRGPHKSHPAAEGHFPEKGEAVPVREPLWPHQAVFRKGRCHRTPLRTPRGAAAFATQALCSDRQGAPSEAPRWVLSTWPEQDKEQYEQHMAQIQVPTHSTQVSPSPQSSPHVMQRLAGKGCPGG